MRNLLPDLLHPRAQLITGSPKPLSMMEGIDDGAYCCAMFVGYHARMGQPGVLSHTYHGAVVREVRLNGRAMGETGINAALAGYFGVPVTLVTGDDRVCRGGGGPHPGDRYRPGQARQDPVFGPLPASPGGLRADPRQGRGSRKGQSGAPGAGAARHPGTEFSPLRPGRGGGGTAGGVEMLDPVTVSFTGICSRPFACCGPC